MAASGQAQSEAVKDKESLVKIEDRITDKGVVMRGNASALPAQHEARRKSILKEHLSKSSPIEIFHKQHAHFADRELKEGSPSTSSPPASPCTLSAFPKEQHPRVLDLSMPLTPTSPSAIESFLDHVPPTTDMGRRQSQTFDTLQMMKDLDDFRP